MNCVFVMDSKVVYTNGKGSKQWHADWENTALHTDDPSRRHGGRERCNAALENRMKFFFFFGSFVRFVHSNSFKLFAISFQFTPVHSFKLFAISFQFTPVHSFKLFTISFQFTPPFIRSIAISFHSSNSFILSLCWRHSRSEHSHPFHPHPHHRTVTLPANERRGGLECVAR